MTPNEQSAALYRTWFGMVDQWARMFSPWLQPSGNPFAAAPTGADADVQGVPEAVKPIAEALDLTRRLLSQSYAALGAAPPGQDWQGLAAANAGRLKAFVEAGAVAQRQWLESSTRAFGALGRAWPGGGQSLASGPWSLLDVRTTHPLLDGLDRTFSALADAFGLGPSRALRDAWRELIAADLERRKAQLDYFAVVAGAWSDVVDGVGIRLREMGARGERVDSLMALVRLWAGVAEKTLHEALQSKPGLDATAAYVRAALRYRQQQNRVVETLSGLAGVPTRTEVDDAAFEIQTLKRQVRELQREVRRLSGAAAPARPGAEEAARD